MSADCRDFVTVGHRRCCHGFFTRSQVAAVSHSYEDAPGLGVGGHVCSSLSPLSAEIPGNDQVHSFGAAGQNGVQSRSVMEERGMGFLILSPCPWVVAKPYLSHSLSQQPGSWGCSTLPRSMTGLSHVASCPQSLPTCSSRASGAGIDAG